MLDQTNNSLSIELLELQRTLGWMDMVLGNITDAVFVTDETGRLIFVNKFFSDLVNIPRVFLLGQKLEEVFRYTVVKDPQSEFLPKAGLSKAATISAAGVYAWANDERHYIFQISDSLIPTTRQIVYIAKDITAEYEISLMKSNFINIASHQLRTPMTAIMTYAHMLSDGLGGPLDDASRKLTKTIIKSSERMIRLINDILLITRIQNGEAKLMTKDSSLLDVLYTVESELVPRMHKKNLLLEKAYDPIINYTACNSFIVHEIISNLITNAIQYTPDNGCISLSANVLDDQVVISVTDNGIGIPEKDLPTVFDQFSRAPNAMEVFHEGTGLGLYVVKILTTQITGTIDCNSKLGEGTSFKVTFPV